jgi:hypothetical protein
MFEPTGLKIAPKTQARFLERITRLFDQGTDEHRIEQYVRRFNEWAQCPGV